MQTHLPQEPKGMPAPGGPILGKGTTILASVSLRQSDRLGKLGVGAFTQTRPQCCLSGGAKVPTHMVK